MQGELQGGFLTAPPKNKFKKIEYPDWPPLKVLSVSRQCRENYFAVSTHSLLRLNLVSMLGKHKYKWPYLLLFSICLSTTSPSTLSPTNFLFSFLTIHHCHGPHSSLPLHALTPPHISLGCFTQAFRFFTPCIIQGGQTSPSLHPHSSILSLKHCMVGISLNLITFIYYHLPR